MLNQKFKLKLSKIISAVLVLTMLLSNVLGLANINTISGVTNKYYNTYIAEAQDVRAPELLPGMTAISFTEGVEKPVKDPLLNKEEWYNYDQKRWANAKTNDGSYWVWIPTFAYKINYYEDPECKTLKGYLGSDSYHFADGRTTNAENVKTSNIIIETIFVGKKGNAPSDFRIHEAFYKDGVMGNGFWIAKYKATVESGTNANQPKFIPDRKQKKVSFDEAFIQSDMSDKYGNNYGFTQDIVKTNLALNKELGALMYLTTSLNGANKKTVDYIPSEYTSKNQMNSTNSNITGVFDLNDGNLEWTAGYIDANRANGSNASILKIMKHNELQKLNKDQKDIDFEAKIEKYPYNENENKAPQNLTMEELKVQRDLNLKELIKSQNMIGGDGIYQTTSNLFNDGTNIAGGENQYPVNKYMNIVRGSYSTDKNKSMYSYRAVNSEIKENMFGYRMVAFRYPLQKDKYITQTFKTPDGEIVDLTDNKAYGKKVEWKLTKGSVLNNELVVKKSRKRFLRWSPAAYNGAPAYNEQEFTPVFEGEEKEDNKNDNQEKDQNKQDNSINISFIDNSDVTKKILKTAKIEKGQTVEQLAKEIFPKKEGYKFEKWDKPLNEPLYQDTEFVAIFKKEEVIVKEKQYEVKFEDENGKVLKQMYVKENTYVDPIKNIKVPNGKKFVGWTPNPETTLINRSMTFKPIFKDDIVVPKKEEKPISEKPELKEYVTIQFLLNGGQWPNQEASKQAIQVIEKGKLVKEPTIYPTRKGFEFIGWDVDLRRPFYGNTVVMARWQEVQSNGKNDDVLSSIPDPTYIHENGQITNNNDEPDFDTSKNPQIGTDPKNPKPIPLVPEEREISKPIPITSENPRPRVEKDIPDAGKKETYIGIFVITLITGLIVTMYVNKQKIAQINAAGKKYFENFKNVTKKK